MSFIESIRKSLEDRNLLEVSKRAGVSYSAVRKVAAGRDNVSVHAAMRLANYLGVSKNETNQPDQH